MSSESPFRPSHRRAVSSPINPARNQPQQEGGTSSLFRSMKSNVVPSDQPSTSQRPRTLRFVSSVKRTLSSSTTPKKKLVEPQSSGMLSTHVESSTPTTLHTFRDTDPSTSRPTIEQIAMGLHLSRTPHLRPTLASSPYAFPQRNAVPLASSRPYEHHHYRSQPIILPPPPSRSSMKKPSAQADETSGTGTIATSSSNSSPMINTPFSSASASTTTITSVTPSSNHAAVVAQSAKADGARMTGIKSRMARFLPHARSTSTPTSLRNSPNGSPRSSSVPEAGQPSPKKAVRFNTEEAAGGV